MDGDKQTKQTTKVLDGKSVLWVEDDKLIGSILSKKLMEAGASVTLVRNGDDALKALTNAVPNVLILDIDLPGSMDGIDILQKVRADISLKNLPVIILSNADKSVYMEKTKLYNVSKFLVKISVTPDEVVREIAELI